VGYWEVKRDLYHVCDSVSFDYDLQQVESFWKWVNRVKYMRIAGVAGKVSSLQSYQSFKGYSNTCGATIWDWIFVKFPVLFFSFHTARVFWKPVKGWTAFGQLQLRARTIDFISRLCWFLEEVKGSTWWNGILILLSSLKFWSMFLSSQYTCKTRHIFLL
jgi:hypothetical protein